VRAVARGNGGATTVLGDRLAPAVALKGRLGFGVLEGRIRHW
jgi:hypothetical protein